LFGDLELDWPAGFLLDYRSPVPYLATNAHIIDSEPHEITAPQLTVDGKIE
jgi:hypothetical protein